MPEFRTVIMNLAEKGTRYNPRQISLLYVLRDTAEPSSRQVRMLADRLKCSRPAITRIADLFCGNGFVKRSKMPADKRSCVLSATPKGLKFLAGIEESAAARNRSDAEAR